MSIEHKWTGFNGEEFDLTEYRADGVWLTNRGIEGMGMPSTPAFTRQTPLLDGQTVSGWRAEPREVFWPIVIDGTDGSWEGLQGRFWATMFPNRYGLWRVTVGESWRELRCRLEHDGGSTYRVDPSITGVEVHGVSMVADDPYWRGDLLSQTFQTAEDVQPFFEPGPTHVLNIMSANTTGGATFENPGDVDAWPIVRVDGPATAFSITGTSGSIVVGVGEWLIVNMDPVVQSAMLFDVDGFPTNVTDQLQQADFLPIPPGTFRFLEISVEGAGSMTVSIVPRFFRAF